ncbi:MAG: RagB/SusD family nutrient uptake outer membrane protein [Saprospiraceae bacterium]
MKNIQSILMRSTLAATLLIISGCSDFLDKAPLGKITSDNAFQTEEDAVLATNAIYNVLRNWEVHVFSYVGCTDIISDDSDKGSTPTDANFLDEIDNFQFAAGNVAPFTLWQGYYKAIFRANIAIEKIPEIEMNAELKERLLAEAKFFRGYFYFNLVRWFGELTIITKQLASSEFKQVKRPVADVYAQIIQDLTEAAAVLPSSYSTNLDKGRVTSGTAHGMLARVYMTMGDWTKCEAQALEVINSGKYSLYPKYDQIFLLQGELSSESVFEVVAGAFDVGNGGSQFNEVQGARGTPNLGWGFNRPSDNFVKEFETKDPRREATILGVGETLPDGSAIVEDNPEVFGERYNQKAWVPKQVTGNGNGPGNIRIMRYSDVLLMAAEAMNENGKPTEALTYLNAVRLRARGTSSTILPDVTTTVQADLRAKIWHERRVELGMEQIRWFDLLRQKRAGEVMRLVGKNFVDNKHELLPIPQSEIDISGTLIQNNGY